MPYIEIVTDRYSSCPYWLESDSPFSTKYKKELNQFCVKKNKFSISAEAQWELSELDKLEKGIFPVLSH